MTVRNPAGITSFMPAKSAAPKADAKPPWAETIVVPAASEPTAVRESLDATIVYYSARDVTVSLDLSLVTPAMIAALAAAQSQVETVGKDASNTQRGYKYASSEAMTRATRRPLGTNGLAFVSTWSREPTVVPGGDIGRQFVCATVRMHFALMHVSGGMIRGFADMDAIGSPARPPDKAVAATLTYMRAFVLRDLLNMDRADEGDDAVDQRDESSGWVDRQRDTETAQSKAKRGARDNRQQKPAQQQTQQPQPSEAEIQARRQLVDKAREYQATCDELGVAPTDWVKIASKAIGRDWDRNEHHTIDEYGKAALAFAAEIGTIKGLAAREANEQASTDSDQIPGPDDQTPEHDPADTDQREPGDDDPEAVGR